ncbi:MAG: metalloregulator ArsR/SmtB family transcription factor [Chloroflexi bacterium]|nr:metalloregulator ArsR/SmtB family transcription factor [Chloroflexota bacterium]
MDHCYTEIPRVRHGDLHLLPDADTVKLAAVASAIGDPIRIQMVYLLEQRPDLCTCEFQELLGLAQSKISYHLNILLEAGIVSRQTHGTWSHYSLHNQEVLNRMRSLTGQRFYTGDASELVGSSRQQT